MSSTSQKNSAPESSEITACKLDVAGKFRIFRMGAESTERKLKEANVAIEQLKEEINSSRDSEKNLRNQLSLAQNRLICLQQALKKVIIASEQQRQNEKVSQQIELKTEKISEAIEQIRKESQNFLRQVSKEVDLMKEIENLRATLAKKTREHDLMKMEIQTLTTEKKNLETESQKKLSNLENELERLKQKEADAEFRYKETLTYYRQELEEKDQAIKHYEKERKSFLDDFEPVKVYKNDSEGIKHGDSIISTTSTKKYSKADGSEGEGSYKTGDSKTRLLPCPQSEERSLTMKFRKKEGQSSSRGPGRQKPQLDFINSSQTTNNDTNGRKRRLFSISSNYSDQLI